MEIKNILFIGNCQSGPIVEIMKIINQDINVDRIGIHELNTVEKFAEIKPSLIKYDHILCHALTPSESHFQFESLPKVTYFPRMTFPGFHPDLTYVTKIDKTALKSSIGDYHSAIAFYGFIGNLSLSETISLYKKETFELLGYFNNFSSSKAKLLSDANDIGWNLNEYFSSWLQKGCFMHTFNHPKLPVLIDLAKFALKKMEVKYYDIAPYDCLSDTLVNNTVFPVYPEIASKLGIQGSYLFKSHNVLYENRRAKIFDLEEFVSESYSIYQSIEPDQLIINAHRMNFYNDTFKAVLKNHLPLEKINKPAINPYKKLPDRQFWKKSITNFKTEEVDPISKVPFSISTNDKVASAGSCFAQHIANTLKRSGYNYFITEKPPTELNKTQAHQLNYNHFSARYGNIYTVKQLKQLFDRAYDLFTPSDEAWENENGRLIDPFRPTIEPKGFNSINELRQSRYTHFKCVRNLFENLDVFIFTLGLTEAWKSKTCGSVFPFAPGVFSSYVDENNYEFVNFSLNEVKEDLQYVFSQLKQINTKAKLILTVSPVPLIATYENKHVLEATTYSKSVLRVACEEICKNYPNEILYFPSYEIITGNFNRSSYYQSDLRSVTQEGVEHVMRLFLKHLTSTDKIVVAEEPDDSHIQIFEEINEVLCDEELLDKP